MLSLMVMKVMLTSPVGLFHRYETSSISNMFSTHVNTVGIKKGTRKKRTNAVCEFKSFGILIVFS